MHTPNDVLSKIAAQEKENQKGSNGNRQKNSDSIWIPFKGLLVNAQYFKYGLVLVAPKHINPIKNTGKADSFFIKDREFFFHVPKVTDKTERKPNLPDSKSMRRAKTLLSKLVHFAASKTSYIRPFDDQSVVLFNKRHREEIFLPIIFEGKDKKKNVGFYFYPWISTASSTEHAKFSPSGFTQYVTAGCLFGSSIKGMDQHGASFELVKHDIKFFSEQKIELIDYDPDAPNPYEQMLFGELEKFCLLIDAFSKPNQPKRLLFHLPYYDYVLFGIELFIRGRITFEALDTFFKLIFEKREEYLNKIGFLCEKYQIEVRIESPFDNLFGCVPKDNITKFILNKLNLTSEEISPNTDINVQQENEKVLVRSCLHYLQSNQFNDEHRQVWQDFVQLAGEDISNLEQLFKIANATMIAIGAKGKSAYEVCSLLPLSEKQIQVTYDSYSKKYSRKSLEKSSLYPVVFNATTFEPLIPYSPTTKGLIFYFAHCKEALAELISSKSILKHSYENVGFFSNRVKQKLESKETENTVRISTINLNQVLSTKPPTFVL